MSLIGGNDFNGHINEGRQSVSESRDALMIVRRKIAEAIRLNQEHTDLIVFLLELSAQLETISQATDELGIVLEKVWAIGAQEKVTRTKKEKDGNHG